jgi:hypothetical protein
MRSQKERAGTSNEVLREIGTSACACLHALAVMVAFRLFCVACVANAQQTLP